MRELISQKRARQIIGKMRGRRLGVVGDWMLDRYVWGTANRISPEAAVPVVDFVKESDCLGGAGNVAANLAALGARVDGFGIVGRDEAGKSLLARMRELKISERGIVEDAKRKTTVKTRIIARQQQIVRVDREDKFPLKEQFEGELVRCALGILPRLDGLVISDYDKGVVTDSLSRQVLEACAPRRLPVFIKPKWSRVTVYPSATVLVVNRPETEFILRDTIDEQGDVANAGARLLVHFGCLAVMITRGENGLDLIERDEPESFHVAASNQEIPMGKIGLSPAHELNPGRQVYDRTGAGDTVLATMALAAASGASLREAAVLGNVAAGVVVGKLGTATLTREELLNALQE
ncbi:MAG TPA: PfkB family carbohydrate kinase [Candidatus Acidoferrales bacterium]|nr:PfkB family carbohydrate kinase [Candidatus Acidoferrales bacterium]